MVDDSNSTRRQRKNSNVPSKRSRTKDAAADHRFPINQPDAMIEGGISANTSDAEPLFNSRSASYFVLQSQLRDIHHDGAESLSQYDRFFLPRSDHLE